MHESLPALDIVAQFPAPEPVPQSLTYDGKQLWIGSWETKQIVAVDRTGRRRTHFAAPAKPVGATFANGHFFYMLSDEADDRTVRSVDEHGTWADDAFLPPDESGSFLSWDGEWLWLSQRFLKRVHRLDPQTHRPLQTIEIGEQVIGHTWIGDWLYVSLWLGKDRGGAVLGRVSGADSGGVQYLASSDFAMISLAYDGDALWANDTKGSRIVAMSLPEGTL